jgi:hypothetical protein
VEKVSENEMREKKVFFFNENEIFEKKTFFFILKIEFESIFEGQELRCNVTAICIMAFSNDTQHTNKM